MIACLFLRMLWILLAAATRAEPTSYLVFVSSERSGDVTVIDGATDSVVGTLSSGETAARHSRDARWPAQVFVTLSGSPRMALGLDENRAPADKRADGLDVIDPSARKLIRSVACQDRTLSNSRSAKTENSHSSQMKNDASVSHCRPRFGTIARENKSFGRAGRRGRQPSKRRSVRHLRRKRRSVRHRPRSTACDRNHRNRRSAAFRRIFT